MAVLDQLDQEAAVVVGDYALREALVLLVDWIVVLAVFVDRAEEPAGDPNAIAEINSVTRQRQHNHS